MISSFTKPQSFFKTDTTLNGGLYIRRGSDELDHHKWSEFIEHGVVDPKLDSVIVDSWKRCIDLGVDPVLDTQASALPSNSQFEMDTLLELADRLDPTILRLMEERELLFVITDAKGRLVFRGGSTYAMRHTDKIGLTLDADWTEGSVGTNAIGTALVEGYPVQVFGREHFRQSHQTSRCTAAPFFNPSGQVMGCVDISSHLSVDHSNNLDLVIGVSRLFERYLLQAYSREIQAWPTALLSQRDRQGCGVIAVQSDGRICGVDELAREVLGISSTKIQGRLLDEFFDISPLKKILAKLHPSVYTTVAIQTIAKPKITAEASPLWSPSGLWLGFLISLHIPVSTSPVIRSSASSAKSTDSTGSSRAGLCSIISDQSMQFIGISESTSYVRKQLAAFAQTPSTVLLAGESGTGKEIAARLIHAQGPRKNGPLISINCGALTDDLIQSELFGYSPGAFTGADRKGKIGFFEQANGGVLFLDEIGELPLKHQVNLLRVLEEKKVTRVGGGEPRLLDVKVVAATNRDLLNEVKQGKFREDLFHRLNVMSITLPPLRSRRDDIMPIAKFHLSRLTSEFRIPPVCISSDVEKVFQEYDWPGNIRSLVNALEYACNQYFIKPFTKLMPDHLPSFLQDDAPCIKVQSLEAEEADIICLALTNFKGNISKTAKALGVSRNTLYTKIKKFEISI